ncbi:MAG: histone deacetylase [Candidatus Thermoplasmatota archaeon]
MTVVYHPSFMAMTQTYGHPECPERVAAIMDRLEALSLLRDVVTPEPAPMEKVLAVHTEEYLDLLRDFGEGYMDPDTYVRPDTLDVALMAAGGALAALDATYEGRGAVFVPLRPPGHHASASRGGGFCYLNNTAIAAAECVRRGDRPAILDFDVHHGNGTSDIFYEEPRVLYISTHQWGIYPGTGWFEDTGAGAGKGYTINVPMPRGAGDSTFLSLCDRLLEPILQKFAPDAVLVSLGGDAHYMDLLGSLSLSTPGYVSLLGRVLDFANRRCGGRLVVLLEGGYHLQALADVAAGFVALFQGAVVDTEFNDSSDVDVLGESAIRRALAVHGERWALTSS